MAENKRIIVNEGAFFNNMHCECLMARTIGKGHVKNNKPCQDFCQIKELSNGYIVLMAADGHGGEKYVHSDFGSMIACMVFYEFLERIVKDKSENELISWLPSDDFKELYIDLWKERVCNYYKEQILGKEREEKKVIEKFGTTFLFVLITDNYYIAGQLGDGAILFFNDDKEWQLLKRHGMKITSSTHSLCGTGSSEAMVIDVYRKEFFQNVIISTDGIYDKLDIDDSFAVYACGLKIQASDSKELCKLTEPFQYINSANNSIDVSEATDDDCSIVLYLSDNNKFENHSTELSELGFKRLKFSRIYKDLIVFKDLKENTESIVHVAKNKSFKDVLFDGLNIVVLNSKETFNLENDYYAKVYDVPKGIISIGELYESGEMLIKKFTTPIERKENPDLDENFPNEFWLKVYENFLSVLDYANKNSVKLLDTFFNTVCVDKDAKLYSFDDCFIHDKSQNLPEVKRFKDKFHILGKITTGNLSYPIYKSKTMQNFIIRFLHISVNSPLMCAVFYNPQKKRYLLWNRSDLAWNVEIADGKSKELYPNKTFPLNRDYIFTVPCKDNFIDPDCELLCEGDTVRYIITILK